MKRSSFTKGTETMALEQVSRSEREFPFSWGHTQNTDWQAQEDPDLAVGPPPGTPAGLLPAHDSHNSHLCDSLVPQSLSLDRI